MRESNYVEPIYYDLFHTVATNVYWLSSRCVDANSNYAYFDVSFVSSSGVYAFIFFISDGGERSVPLYVRPVVSLESNVEIDTSIAGKDGSSPDKAWVIK